MRVSRHWSSLISTISHILPTFEANHNLKIMASQPAYRAGLLLMVGMLVIVLPRPYPTDVLLIVCTGGYCKYANHIARNHPDYVP